MTAFTSLRSCPQGQQLAPAWPLRRSVGLGRPGGYVLAHVEGVALPSVNGNALVGETVHLKNGDVIELAGTQMQFVQA